MPLTDNPLMQLKNMPASAQDIPDENDINSDFGIDLNLHQCQGCGLIQFDCEPVSYYRDVIRAGGYSTTMTELRRKQYKHFIDSYNLKGKKIIEIGCGQGEFLNVLNEFPVQAYGIENKSDLVEIAKSKNLNVTKNFTESADTRLENGPFSAFLSFNFLEHQPDPNTMLQCIYNNLEEDGYGIITVPAFEYILENNSFYELIRDHIANYTKESLRFLIEKNGFEMLECNRINRDTWEMIVKKRSRTNVNGLLQNYSSLKKQMQDYFTIRNNEGKKVAVWGASHQGFTTLSSMGISNKVAYIIDSAPFKQGKLSPASHIKIVSPEYYYEEPVECILIIAPGYTEEIIRIIQSKYGVHVEIAILMTDKIQFYSSK